MRTVEAPRTYLTVKEVMILRGCQRCTAYKIIQRINQETQKMGYEPFGAGKANKYVYAKIMGQSEKDIDQAIKYVSTQKKAGK